MAGPTWKYRLGDFVTPSTHAASDSPVKMLVVALVTMEFANLTERYYLCARHQPGDYSRSNFSEPELAPWPSPVPPTGPPPTD